jgi:multidrug resistance efflux pump
MRRIILVTVLVVVALFAIAGGIFYYFYNNYLYYSTDDAQVTGTVLNVSSPAAGQVDAWTVALGSKVTAGQQVGTVTTVSTVTGKPDTVKVTSPISGTIVQDSTVSGQAVAVGSTLAEVTDLNNVSITAYVDEGEISNVKVGQEVDITIDAYKGTSYKGHIQTIVSATAGTFSLLPTNDVTSGNFSKVTQRIPVIISLEDNSGTTIVPGLSAEVKVHLH